MSQPTRLRWLIWTVTFWQKFWLNKVGTFWKKVLVDFFNPDDVRNLFDKFSNANLKYVNVFSDSQFNSCKYHKAGIDSLISRCRFIFISGWKNLARFRIEILIPPWWPFLTSKCSDKVQMVSKTVASLDQLNCFASPCHLATNTYRLLLVVRICFW